VGIVVISSISWLGLGQISGAISRIDAFGAVIDRPDKPTSALNYLIVGADTREGLTKEQRKLLRVGSTKTAAGSRSDTMLIVHISKSRDKATIISIPRDSLVTIPEHPSSSGSGKIIPAALGKINAAFAFGGPPLLIQTIEDETSIRIDHYIEIGFAGFAGMVDSLGGIEVCTQKDIDDPGSHLVLAAGVHTLNGIEALKYVRTRDFDGRGDIGRMERQQQFISAVLRKATSTGVLLNPIKLANFYNATISTVKMDEGLDKNDLLTLAKQMRNLSSGNIRTLTVPIANPNGRHPEAGSVVIWDEVLAADLWTRVRNDDALIDKVKKKKAATATEKAEAVDKFKSKTAADNPCAPV
jgi:LCP family protein required for cell wall assembly